MSSNEIGKAMKHEEATKHDEYQRSRRNNETQGTTKHGEE
jgi:hypothetical protein